MSIEDHYRSVRNCARQLAYRESLYVVWAYTTYLQIEEFNIPNDIEAANQFLNANPHQAVLAEWTLEHIAREVIRYGEEVPRHDRSLRRWDTLAQIANALRDLEGAIYVQLVGGARIQLDLMRIAHRQFIWQQQRPNSRWIIRYYKLFNIPAIDALSAQATGLSIDEIFLIGMCYLGIFFDNPRSVR